MTCRRRCGEAGARRLLAGDVVAGRGANPGRRAAPDVHRGGRRNALSLSLPPGERTHAGAPVVAFLDALLPESQGARAAIGRTHGADPGDLLDLLAAIGKDCAGAVQLCPPDDVDATRARDGSLEPCSDGEIEARLDAMDLDDGASWVMPDEHWSLGGTQGKLALRRQDGAWFVAHGAEPTTHILKPGVLSLRAQALLEHVSMHAARMIGLDVARTEYRTFRSRNAIVVTRFDRLVHDSGAVDRRHQEDMSQALGTVDKYEEYRGPSAADITRLLRESSPTRPLPAPTSPGSWTASSTTPSSALRTRTPATTRSSSTARM